MSKIKAMAIPPDTRSWRILSMLAILTCLLLLGPIVARADDGGRGEREGWTHFTTVGFIMITDPGTVTPLSPDGSKLSTSGEKINGCISSSTWAAIPVVSGACSPNKMNLAVSHSSTIKAAGGQISGTASGMFTVGAFKGNYSGTIAAQYDVALGLRGMYHIADRGTWSASDNRGNKAQGTFTLDLKAGIIPGTLAGSVVLDGVHNRKGD